MSRLDQLTLAMTSLTERLAGEGTRQSMEYEESVHNVPAIAQNAIVSMTKKVEDNVLHIKIVPMIELQPATPQNPVTKLLHTLLKVPNTLAIKKVRMPLHKLKAAKSWPKFAEAHAQQ